MTRFKTISTVTGLIAAASMAATPISAAELPALAPQSMQSAVPIAHNWEPDSEIAERHRHRRYRHHRHRRGVDAGDVVAGVLILGGIAAIASAASNNKRDRRQRYEQPRYRTNNARTGARTGGGQGIDRAVDMCLREIERTVRVDGVDTVNRSSNGWNVTGRLYNGDGFTCQIGNDGKVDGVSYGGQTAAYSPVQTQDRQHSSDRYAAAWNRVEGRSVQPAAQPTGPQPAYPGGPLPGEERYQDDRLGG